MKKIKVNSKVYLIPIILVFLLVVTIYYGHYENTIEILESQYAAKINLIEQSIYNETKYTEVISKIAERDLVVKMEKNTKIIADKYKEDKEFLNWDYQKLKNQIDDMDIYILDKKFNVVASSIEKEIGLNFDELPDFTKILIERLEGKEFASDTVNFSLMEGELRKYGYMPTEDNEYLIEISVNIKDLYPELENLNIIYLSNDLKDKYPFVEDIKVYKFNKKKEYFHELDTSKKEPDKYEDLKKEEYVKKALKLNEAQEQTIKGKDNNTYNLKYIPYTAYYEDDRLTWWRSYIIEVVYNNESIMEEISDQKKLFSKSISIISLSYLIFTVIIINLISKNQRSTYIDHLTKLPNRKKLEEVIEFKIGEANKKNTKFAILFFDLDKFKNINDTFGHNIGDKVLQEVANRIKSEIPKKDIICRLGGDEFIGLISDIRSDIEIVHIGERMSALFDLPLNIDGLEISIRPSLGISIYPEDGKTGEDLILKADNTMYEAKKEKTRYKIYKDKSME